MKFLLSFFLLVSTSGICQTVPGDVSLVDSTEADISSGSPDTLAQNLTAPYPTDMEKVRSIFKWITENIAYDTKGYYNLKNIYRGLFQLLTFKDSASLYKNYNDNIVKKVLKEKVAICDGYTRLFKALCDRANIKSEIVIGYVRWYSDSIGEPTKRIHAWNAAEIDHKWYLLDATWASGYSNTEVTKFKKEYDSYYFLTPPEQLINDHFPVDSKWTLLSYPVTIDEFYNQPYLFSAFRKYDVKSFKPAAGLIETKPGDKVLFEIETDTAEKEMIVLPSLVADSSEYATAGLLNISNENTALSSSADSKNKVTYLYSVNSPETKELNVIYKGEPLIRYRVRLKK